MNFFWAGYGGASQAAVKAQEPGWEKLQWEMLGIPLGPDIASDLIHPWKSWSLSTLGILWARKTRFYS